MTTNINQILAERGKRYGKLLDVAVVAQGLKATYRKELYGKLLAPDMYEALDTIMSKVARIVVGDETYVDSWVDIAGYAKLVADRLEEEA